MEASCLGSGKGFPIGNKSYQDENKAGAHKGVMERQQKDMQKVETFAPKIKLHQRICTDDHQIFSYWSSVV